MRGAPSRHCGGGGGVGRTVDTRKNIFSCCWANRSNSRSSPTLLKNHSSSSNNHTSKNGTAARLCLLWGSNRNIVMGFLVIMWSLMCVWRVQEAGGIGINLHYQQERQEIVVNLPIHHLSENKDDNDNASGADSSLRSSANGIVQQLQQQGNATPTVTVQDQTMKWLKTTFTSPHLAVVFADSNFIDFTLNSYAGFEKNCRNCQYLMVGMDDAIVAECSKRGIPSLIYTDILGESSSPQQQESEPQKNAALVRMRCARMDVVLALQRAGFHIFLLDSDIAVAKGFDMSYFANLDADFISGRGTFPRGAFQRNKFTLQSGFYIAKSTPIGIEFFANATALCRDHGDGQRALNQVVMDHLRIPKKIKPIGDHWGTKIYNAYSVIDFDPKKKPPPLEEEPPLIRFGILGDRFFPTGCEFLKVANHSETIVKHPFCMKGKGKILERRVQLKKASLAEQGGWYLEQLEYNVTELLAKFASNKKRKQRNSESEE